MFSKKGLSQPAFKTPHYLCILSVLWDLNVPHILCKLRNFWAKAECLLQELETLLWTGRDVSAGSASLWAINLECLFWPSLRQGGMGDEATHQAKSARILMIFQCANTWNSSLRPVGKSCRSFMIVCWVCERSMWRKERPFWYILTNSLIAMLTNSLIAFDKVLYLS